jgi:hypothetical protein
MSTQWFCRILHEEFGPLDFDELQELALSGTLDRGDLVRRDTEDVWTAASKCLELRATFRKLEPAAESLPTRNETALSAQPEPTSGAHLARQDHAAEEDTPNPATASSHPSDPITSRQRWIAWSATAGLMLILFVADRLIASATPTFPQPRQVREQLAGLHWFLGTGPWSPWECRLLWFDALVILSFASGWLTRKLTR